MKIMDSHIVIDMNALIYGSRAVRRCSECLVSELVKNDCVDYTFLYFDYKLKKSQYFRADSFNVTQKIIPIPYSVLIPFWKRFSWPKFEAVHNPADIFYTNEFYFPPKKRTIIIATIHGLAYKIIPDKMPLRVIKSLEQGLLFILKHADYLIAVSQTTKNELISKIGVDADRIYVVTHGVDSRFKLKENRYDVKNRLSLNFGISNPYILFVGAIGLHKNILGILSAYEELSNNISIDLVMAGPPDSAFESVKKFLLRHNMHNSVHVLGHISDTETLADLYNGAELFVFPSFYEGWTSPPLEAMACGTPVITSNCSSLPETVGEAAIQVDPNDSIALANQMERVLSDRTLQRDLIKKGFEHVSKHTWKKAAKKMVYVFEDILSKGRWEKKHI